MENKDIAISSFRDIHRITLEEDILNINNAIPIFPRPGLIDANTIEQIGRDSEQILKIITSLPKRIFNGDLLKFCSYLGFTDTHYELISQTFDDNLGLMSRGDLFFDGSGEYKFLEFNVDSSVGGLEIASVNKVMEDIHFYREWLNNNNFHYDDPLLNFVNMIKKVTFNKGMKPQECAIAVIDWHTYIDGYMWSLNLIKQYLEDAGFKVILCNQKEVLFRNGYLYYENEKIDLVYRVFLSDDALDNPKELDPILTAYRQKNLILINGVHTEIYSNKAIFALLSDPKYEEYYTKEEKILIDKCIPLTRVLQNENTFISNQKVNLIEHISQNKDSYVIKPGMGYGGESILLGWNLSDEEWNRSISNILNSNIKYVVQERINPVIEEMPLLYENNLIFEKVVMNWGVYVFDDKYSGAMIRGLSNDNHGVINAAQGASMTCTFYKGSEK